MRQNTCSVVVAVNRCMSDSADSAATSSNGRRAAGMEKEIALHKNIGGFVIVPDYKTIQYVSERMANIEQH